MPASRLLRTLIVPSAAALFATACLTAVPAAAQSAADPASDRQVRPLLDMILPGYDARTPGRGSLSADDEAAIKAAATRLHLALDTRQFEAMGAMFTDDGVLDYQFGYATGRDAIARMFRAHRTDATGARHHAMNELVVGNSDGSATLYGYLLVMLVADAKTGAPLGPRPIASGVETFRFRKVDGQWLIARMTQEETVLDATLAKPEQVRYAALTAAARARANGRAPGR